MLAKIIAVVLLAAVSASPAKYGSSYSQPQQATVQHDIDYKVKWEVKDEPSYNYQTRDESKYADRVEGSYSFVEADGTLRVVTYTADANGFVAHVENKPLTFDAPTYDSYSKYEAPQSQYQQAAPQKSHYQQAAQHSHYQQSAQSNYKSSDAAGGVTIFSAPPAPVDPNDKVTQFSAPGKPTFTQSSEVSFRPVVRPTMNTFQPQQSNYGQSDSGSKYH